ncbi:hypothetical protein GYMLUDRAFT_46984 [Collybiopsis luxurians FD-317 M1]|uniref:THH1/TOM1/TOM3 domain-containing protein n=1 Tax=Collybiopsis luxurians FD-317 M1 TaxID=944289 RepID=A0A0D0CF25_9AGAR|nr:hypothetical protein GYMLUDRAFT_46984 [Collybiopsis luxurians FD-317 M1]
MADSSPSKDLIRVSFAIVYNVSTHLSLLIGDMLVFWRARAVWYDSKFAQRILILFGISEVVFLVLSTVRNWKLSNGPDHTFESVFNYTLFLFCSLVSNLLVTLAVAYKALFYSRILRISRKGSQGTPGKTPVQRMLLVLMESGIIFSILQAIFYVLAVKALTANRQSHFFLEYAAIIQYLGPALVSFYPTVIFIVSHLIGRSN